MNGKFVGKNFFEKSFSPHPFSKNFNPKRKK